MASRWVSLRSEVVGAAAVCHVSAAVSDVVSAAVSAAVSAVSVASHTHKHLVF